MYNLLPHQKDLLRALVAHYELTGGRGSDFIFAQAHDGGSLIPAKGSGRVEYNPDISSQDFIRLAEEKLISISQRRSSYYVQLTALGVEAVKQNFTKKATNQGLLVTGGDLRGAIFNINTTLRNVTQKIENSSIISSHDKIQLDELIQELIEQLAQLPQEQYEVAETIAQCAKGAVKQLDKEEPNRRLLGMNIEGLKQAAEDVREIAPTILQTALAIIAVMQPYM